ncbi:hypothetical protein [uncultured Sneathiella sp.]|uniref:hypothetical protein n=1 Tax=uncultured Sneathiella sp. TaxID=879315 RepID=UPI0030DC80A0|tara:strand:- start:772 stop:1899 length:1128 start_codon:yes stop_codon:yes gene_type:complete
MENTEPDLELIYLFLKEPFPDELLGKMRSVLAMYGYSLLVTRNLTSSQISDMAVPADRSHGLALIVQDIQPCFGEKYGDRINLNIFKAVKGIVRKFKEYDFFVVTPRSLSEHKLSLDWLKLPDHISLQKLAKENIDSFTPPYPVILCISNENGRTRIDKVDFKGEQAVCKTFCATNLEGLQKEIEARRLLSDKIPEIAPILEYGENYMMLPYYEAAWRWDSDSLGLMPIKYAEKCLDIIRRIHAENWAVVDWHPGNFIFCHGSDVVLIDLEALLPQPERVPFEQSADILGYPNFPYQGKPTTYANTWQSVVGLPLPALLNSSATRKRFLRGFYFVTRSLPKWLTKRTEQALRKLYRHYVGVSQIKCQGRFLVYRF